MAHLTVLTVKRDPGGRMSRWVCVVCVWYVYVYVYVYAWEVMNSPGGKIQ
jgi:hypothetical protein